MTNGEENSNYIKRAADCSIKLFMACLFDEDYKSLIVDKALQQPTDEDLQVAFSNIYLEYVDLSGMSDNEELSIIKDVNRHSVRIDVIKALLYVQYTSLLHFEQPHKDGVEAFARFGHKLRWRKDSAEFKKQLQAIERKESKTAVFLAESLKKLEQLRKRQQLKQSGTIENARKQFKTLIHTLQKEKYVIEYDTTPIEDLAIMIAEYNKHSQQTLNN